MRLLMLSGDEFIARKEHNVFYNMLREYSRYWETIDIITPGGFSREAFTMHGNVTVHPSMAHQLFHIRYIYTKGLQLWRQKPFDLITIHDYPPFRMGIGGWLLGKNTHTPYVLEFLHIVGHPKAPNLKEHLSRELTRLYLRLMWKHAAAIRVANHIEVPEFLHTLGIPDDHILITSCLHIDLTVFKPLHLQKTGQKVLFTGRLVENKGILELIQAFHLVHAQRPGSELVIVGGGRLKEKLVRLVNKLDIARSVTFVDTVPHEAVARVLNECDIFVSPSYNEGGPRSAVEAMACGLPVISTRIGTMKEIIQDGENGLFISWNPNDIAEKILRLLQDDALREKIGVNGCTTAQEFEYAHKIRLYAEGFQALIERERRGEQKGA